MNSTLFTIFFSISCLISFNTHYASPPILSSKPDLRWDWDAINTSSLAFPAGFMMGTCTAEYQVSGSFQCPNTNWAEHELKKTLLGGSTIQNSDRSGKACEHWNRYKQDIALMKELGVTAYRFSVEWSRIEPREGIFDRSAIEHYHNVCDSLIEAGITPVITLHHFTNPLWFERKGAFEKEENIAYFVRYAKKVFNELGSKVPLWCTINEPGMYAFMGYIKGDFPPAEKMSFKKAGMVTKHLLQAHVRAYKALKALPNGQKAQIGLVHSLTQFEPYHEGVGPEHALCYYLNQYMHRAILQFLVTGKFQLNTITSSVTYEDPNAPSMLDFIGLNYYSHVLVNLLSLPPQIPAYRPGDIPTDMPYGLYAEGLYQAIQEVAAIGVPIYITENGIADKTDDRRELYIKRYLYALSQAINDGYDVRGYFYWSLMDNFEWSFGYSMKFGLYEVNFKTQERTLRKGSGYFKEVAQLLRNQAQAVPQQNIVPEHTTAATAIPMAI